MEINHFSTQSFCVLFIKVIIYAVYLLCHSFIDACNFIVNQKIFENRHSALQTAKYGQIIWRHKLSMNDTSKSDFLYVFTARVSPEYALRPNVSLYEITDREAIFVEVPEDVNIYSSDVDPFFFTAQYHKATSVIEMSINDFMNLADKIGNPKVPVIWVSNTGRCGGTMLCQIFESVPGTLVISEPNTPLNVVHLRRCNRISGTVYDSMLKSTIRVFCKPHPGIERICIKPRPVCTTIMMDISKLCPGVRQIFIYRNSQDTVRSWLSFMRNDAYYVVMRTCVDVVWLSNLCPYFRNVLQWNFVPEQEDNLNVQLHGLTTACTFVYAWVNHMIIARNAMSYDHTILAVKYEDIISSPEEAIRHIFDSFSIDEAHIDLALSTLNRHSQRGSFLGREIIGTINRCLSNEDVRQADHILTRYKLPSFGESYRL